MVEERYKRQLQYQWGSPYCAKWYCHNCMTFDKKEALHHCQTCGTIRPDFTMDGKHDRNCFWSIKSNYPESNGSNVDDEPKKFTHWEMAKDMIKNMPSIGQERANLVPAVQAARRRYVHITDREIKKEVDANDDSSIASYWTMDSVDSDDNYGEQIDSMLMDDEIPRSPKPTRAMIAFYCFEQTKHLNQQLGDSHRDA
jgi:uncharacterized Zn finger protein